MSNSFTPPPGATPSIAFVTGAINQQAGAASGAYDSLFRNLLGLEWKGIAIPYEKIRNKLRHDLAIHKFVDRNGAHIEGTGRAPLEFTARVPLLNGLTPGQTEGWAGNLYPDVFNNLLRACIDKSSGVLQHPELGPITCKVQTMEWDLVAQVRSGVWVDFSWIETDDTGQDLDNNLGSPSDLSNAQGAANDLDSQLAALVTAPGAYVPPQSFTSIMQRIRAVTDLPTLLQKQYGGQCDNLIYQANQLRDSLNRSANALNWPILQASERAKEAAYALKQTLLTKGRQVLLFTVIVDSSMALVSSQIPANLGDLMLLNPAYLQSPLVPSGAQVRYYASGA
jgi:hypothetical protein